MKIARETKVLVLIQICSFCFCIADYAVPLEERAGSYWRKKGEDTLMEAVKLHEQQMNNEAKNVIFFLGDGMGITTITAMRIYKGQKAKKDGESEQLAFEKFPYVSLSKTYALDRQTPDSANTATAYFCGAKANYQTIGVDGRVKLGDCEASLNEGNQVHSVLEYAQDEGKLTGIVTSTRVTHATPAGLYSHIADRNWESWTPDPKCPDIATQLVRNKPGKHINVIMGGGSQVFLPSTEKDSNGEAGNRSDTTNLIDEWVSSKNKLGVKAQFVANYEEFNKINPMNTDYVLGLFNASHLPYVTDRDSLKKRPPTLVEMTKKAIQILQKGPKGFFLAVEGGRIDMGHHEGRAKKALEEGIEFDQAVQAAVDMTDSSDTLILVTADHSHTFTIGGDYPPRGNDILGIGGISDIDNLTLTTLTYANGPGYKGERSSNLTEEEAVSSEYRQDAAVPLKYETHGAEDVAVYAMGPKAHLFHGVHDQSYIPYAIKYASCTGPNRGHCKSASIPSTVSDKNVLLVLPVVMYLSL